MAENVVRNVISWDVEINDIINKLSQTTNISNKEAKKMVDGLSKEWQRYNKAQQKSLADAQKAQKKGLTDAQKEAAKSFDTLNKTAEKALGQLGGQFGTVKDVLFDFVAPLGEVAGGFGAVGVAAAAAALAVGGYIAIGAEVISKTYEMADAGLQAKKNLEQMGLAALIPPDSAESLVKYEESQKRLNAQLDVASVNFGSKFGPALSSVNDVLTVVVGKLDIFAGWLTDAYINRFSTYVDYMEELSFLTWIYRANQESLNKTLDETNEKLQRQIEIAAKSPITKTTLEEEAAIRDQLIALGMLVDEEVKGNDKIAKSFEDRINASITGIESYDKRTQSIISILNDKYREHINILNDVQKANGELNMGSSFNVGAIDSSKMGTSSVESFGGIQGSTDPSFEDMLKKAEERKQAMQDLGYAISDFAGTSMDAIGSVFDIMAEQTQERIDGIIENLDKIKEKNQEVKDRISELNQQLAEEDNENVKNQLKGLIAIEQAKIKANKDDLRRAQNRLEREGKLLKKQFNAKKAADIASAVTSGASAAVAALLPPPIGAGPLTGGILAASVGVATAAQVATIAAQKPPSYHIGGRAPDEQTATLRTGEGVLSQRAMNQLLMGLSSKSNQDDMILYADFGDSIEKIKVRKEPRSKVRWMSSQKR